MRRFRLKSWLATLIAFVFLVTLAPVTPVQAASAPTLTDADALVMLQTYGIVKGDPSGNLLLDQRITRAQAAAIFVRAMGGEEIAKLLQGHVEFADTVGHWANGEVVMAKRLGLMQGDGISFRPDDDITYAELMTVMLRMVEREPTGPWNPQGIMVAAEALGITPAVLDATMLASIPAVRESVFVSLARTIATIPLSTGETLLQRHVDSEPPTLSVDPVTPVGSATSVTIAGQVQGAWKVFVNDIQATVTGTRFSANVPLSGGVNTISVVAVDLAGNEAKQTVTVTVGGAPARIEVTGPTQVAANGTVKLNVQAFDADGVALGSSQVAAQVISGTGTFTASTGDFKAGATAGPVTIRFTAGTITETFEIHVTGVAANASGLQVVNEGQLATVNQAVQVRVQVIDNEGTRLSYDTGRNVTLTADNSAVTITRNTVQTQSGEAVFTVSANAIGDYVLTASAPGLSIATTTLSVGTSTRVVLEATPSTVVANGSNAVSIRATLRDQNGNLVVNQSDTDILVSLQTSSMTGVVSGAQVRIPRGTSSSAGWDGQYIVGNDAGRVVITGRVVSNHGYSVQSTAVQLTQLVLGNANRMEVVGAGGGYKSPGEWVNLAVRVADTNGNAVVNGSYAFQLAFETSNTHLPVTNGLPEGVEIEFANGTLYPVYQGGTWAVVARTEDGVANFRVRYDRSGRLTVKLVGVSSTDTAYNSAGDPDRASSTVHFNMAETLLQYDDVAGGTAGIDLRWEMTNLRVGDAEAAILSANGSTSAKLTAYLVDAKGGRRPTGSGTMTLTRTGAGSRVNRTSAPVNAGVAEFTVTSTTTADIDTYTISYGGHSAQTTVQVEKDRAAAPIIISAYSETGNLEKVSVQDSYLELSLTNMPNRYGILKVYRSNNSLVWTSGVIDLGTTTYVRVPVSALPIGSNSYKVTVNTGAGDSIYSNLTAPIVTARAVKIDISSVRYDAAREVLKVNASGVSTASGGVIYAENLALRRPTETFDQGIWLGAADCTVRSGGFDCDLSGFGLDAATFHGAWLLDTKGGWFVRTANGDSAAMDERLDNNYVTPFAYISHVSLDVAGNRVTLHGVNLNQGSIYPYHLLVNDDPELRLAATASTRQTTTTSTAVTFTVPAALMSKLADLNGPNIRVYAYTGWLRDTANNNSGPQDTLATAAPLYASVSLTRTSYDPNTNILTIFGAGLNGGEVNLSKLFLQHRTQSALKLSLANSTPLNLEGGKVNGNFLQIELDTDTAGQLELAVNKGHMFLHSEETSMTTGQSWFEDEKGRLGVALRQRTYLVNW